jgi:hypothetical protein
MPDEPQNLSFEEFKLYYESTEKVTDRRLETNRWNYSTCVAILVGVAAIIKWGVVSTELRWLGVGAVFLLCLMAILFCQLWVAQIRDFKRLNDAKFEVLNRMAPRVVFSSSGPATVVSARPFEQEWERLKAGGAVERVQRLNLIALKSSQMEQFIPRAFQTVFVAVMAALVFLLATTQPFPAKPPAVKAQSEALR